MEEEPEDKKCQGSGNQGQKRFKNEGEAHCVVCCQQVEKGVCLGHTLDLVR